MPDTKVLETTPPASSTYLPSSATRSTVYPYATQKSSKSTFTHFLALGKGIWGLGAAQKWPPKTKPSPYQQADSLRS
ncbi:hypothetical protein Slin15195_G122710 [Septoria linicola]|uniref:Uncharacterized protein n=1 Tax=Septoria linicola TaxID=215465 RepID=A0A9Q9EQM2_9PEZI|nr:hypothetical protein Slin14017_G078910 [Septoria linicola]USW58952.1 hypothetical protein Slin15195_G122710 [Septoria linicola]